MTEKKLTDSIKVMQATAARGAGWAIALGLGSRVLALIGSVVITHMLDPDVMGEVSIAVIVVVTMNTFSTIGYGHYMLAKPTEGRAAIWHITVLHLAIGVVALIAVQLLGRPIAVWMNAPSLPKYLPWLVVCGLLDRLTFVPERVLIRAMLFKRVATTRSLSELSYMASALTLVALGFGGYGIVLANVLRAGLKFTLFASAAPRAEWLTPTRLSLAKYKEILGFGVPLAIGGWVNFAAARWDNLIISMLYGPALMGQYNVAYNLADVPADQIGEQAAEVLLPSLARVKREERPPVLLYSMGMLSFVIFPVSIGLGLVATTAAHTFIGSKWDDVGPMMTILCVLSIARPLSHQIHAFMLSNGRPRLMLFLEIGKLTALVTLLLTLGRVSPHWACVAVGIAFLSHALVAQFLASRLEKFRVAPLYVKTLRPLAACLPLVGGVLLARWAMSSVHVRGLDLVAEIVAGAIGYLGGAMLIARQQVGELVDLVKNRKRKAPAPTSESAPA